MSAHMIILPIAFLFFGAVVVGALMYRSVTTPSAKTTAPTPLPSDPLTPRVLNLTRAPSLFSAGDTSSPFSASPNPVPSVPGNTFRPSLTPTRRPRSPSLSPTYRPAATQAPTPKLIGATPLPSLSPTLRPTTKQPSVLPTMGSWRPSRAPSKSPTLAPVPIPQVPLRKQNILLVIVDDLGGAVGSFGDTDARTPNIDSLASRGLRFINHHVPLSDCAPSRASLLTGKRPDELQMYAGGHLFRSKNANLMTMPAHFRRLGYRTVSIGKVFDRESFAPSPSSFTDVCASGQDSASTSCSFDEEVPALAASQNSWVCPLGAAPYPPNPGMAETLLYYGEELGINATLTESFPDSCIARHVQAKVNEFALNTSRPFFLAVGLSRPRPPWTAPRESWEVYPRFQEQAFAEQAWTKDISGSFFTSHSSGASQKVGWSELAAYSDEASAPTARKPRAYYVSVSHVDVVVGRVARVISTHPSQIIRENTIMVLWGDNGVHIGPLLWGPRTIFEQATRTPLIIVPSVNWRRYQDSSMTGIGQVVDWPVETVDVYPTLVQLANVDTLIVDFTGVSLVPYFFDRTSAIKTVAVSQCPDQRLANSRIRMGYSLRSLNYRLIRYYVFDTDCHSATLRTGCVFSNALASGIRSELYYYSKPGDFETVNVYNDAAHTVARDQLLAIMATKDPQWSQI